MPQSVIRLQFVASDDIGSAVIRWFAHGERVSHVDAILPDGRLLGARYDDIGGGRGVHIRPPDYEKWSYRKVVALPCSAVQSAQFYDFLRQQIGKPYDWTAIAAFFMDRNWRQDDAWYCSEMQARGLEKVEVVRPLIIPANRITPGDLLLVCSALVAL